MPPVACCLVVGVTLGQTVDSLITLLYICWRDTLPTVYLTMSPNETQVVTFIPLNLVLFSPWSPGPAARTLAPPPPAQPCGGLYRRKPPLTQQGKEPSLQARKERQSRFPYQSPTDPEYSQKKSGDLHTVPLYSSPFAGRGMRVRCFGWCWKGSQGWPQTLSQINLCLVLLLFEMSGVFPRPVFPGSTQPYPKWQN